MAMALCVSCKKDDDSSDSGGGNGGGGNTGGGGGGSQTVEMRLSKMSRNMVEYIEESTDGGQTWNVIGERNRSINTNFTWDNNLLSKWETVYYVEGVRDDLCAFDFSYDNNKLSNAIRTLVSGNGRIDTVGYFYDITYDGDNMIEVTYREEFYEVYHNEYSNGKLSSVTRSNGGPHASVNYFWNGDNLSEIRSAYFSDGISFLSYDDKNNPFYGIDAFLLVSNKWHPSLLGSWWELFCICSGSSISKNNFTKGEELFEGWPITETVEYTYNDKNYPTQAVANMIVSDPDEYSRSRYIETITYEYLD